jgi:hypothetical protein
MPEELFRCISCGKAIGSETEPCTRNWGVADQAGERPLPEGPPEEYSDICESCVALIDARFRRPNPGGEGTLAQVLVCHFESFKAALRESLDPDIREVLPNLPRELLPKRRKWRRQATSIKAILARLRKPVCWYDPALARAGEGPFWIFHLHHENEGICHAMLDYFDVAELRDFVNALDYSTDGTPISASRKPATPGGPTPRRTLS